MSNRRTRRPLLYLWTLLVVATASLAACHRHQPASPAAGVSSTSGSSTTGTTSQAQRTRDMEDKAKEMNRQAGDIQNMQGTEQEKIDAVNKLEQQRQDLSNQAETTGSGTTAPPPQ
ncbi:MAG: hypothetical protein M3O15_11380 [Acidobacteriota bacterium]|nr:hypothetical protein [Acidobacteriota bacterium]